MLVSEEHVVEEVEADRRARPRDSSGVRLRANRTEPSVLADGVDSIVVADEGDDETYRIDYRG